MTATHASLVRFERRYLLPAATCFVLGLGVLVYRGPGRALVRGHVGDVLVVAFLYFLLSVFVELRASVRVAMVGSFALGTEFYQYAIARSGPQSTLHALTFGAFADPYDLVAYALGLVLAVAFEHGVLGVRARQW